MTRSDPLLSTKLFVPRPPSRTVARPHLLARLEGWEARKLTLVSAPPGFGKTTLVSTWAAGTKAAIAWVSLDEEDNDPVRFWTYVVRALSEPLGAFAAAAEEVLRSPSPSIKALIAELINRLAQHGTPVVLVLDDYHAITAEPIHQTLSLFIDRLPEGIHVVLATRSDPPFMLARLRAQGHMIEFRAADLRFDAGEAATYLNERMNLALPDDALKALTRSTEGWVTGLQLAALSLQHAPDRGAFVSAFAGTNRYIVDYLVEEVLRTQSPAVQRFLLETSILERLSAPLCDALLDASDSQRILDDLEQANLFLVPLDGERRWYRYHHLFADMLRHLLERQAPGALDRLHARASQWFEQHGHWSEAIHHARTGRELSRVADLIAEAAPKLGRGEIATLLGWLSALPPAELDRRADLLLLKAWVRFPSGDHAELSGLMRRAEQALAAPLADESRRPILEAQFLSLQAFTARAMGDLATTIRLSEQALAALPASEPMWRIGVGLNLATAYQHGDRPQEALDVFDQLLAAANAHDTILALGLKATCLQEFGQPNAARPLFASALTLAEAHGGRANTLTSYAWVGLGNLHLQQGEYDEALRCFQEGRTTGEGLLEPHLNACMQLAWLHARKGEREQAERYWQEAHQVGQALPNVGLYLEAQRALCLDENEPALERFVAATPILPPGVPRHWPLPERPLLLAKALLALGETERARTTLEEVEANAQEAGRRPLALQAMLLRARMLPEAEALALLRHAVTLAEPEGLRHAFLDAGTALQPLWRKLTQAPDLPTPTRRFLGKLAALPEGPSSTSPLLEPLSEREREVLRLIAEGLTNQAIAEKLVIELSTVKRHGTNLYGKLGASNRTTAIARARALGLL